ncbi:chemotaxis protein CheW [Alicyclobacillus contaminans]|uniref:chemotaxis protein CheW n=1 Tax=Alicyclobacillus contaminans TaxID=392016 RepID=UPI00047A3950|nr:chemotaxis protein CheW [Alicyclobacillus contaminans]
MVEVENQYVVIELGQEKYAIRIHDVYEVIKMQTITELPNTVSFFEGVINLRGKIVPVISLRKRFGMEEAPVTKSTRIVVVNRDEEQVGIVVDGVTRVTTFTDIQPPPNDFSAVDVSYLSGIGHSEHGLISLLNIPQILMG